jgi:glycosyltransferase involved in cell wall biosynthesis
VGDPVYVVERFPERSESFVQHELRALAARGVYPRVFTLGPANDPDPEAGDLTATRLPSVSARPAAATAAVLTALARNPIGWLGGLGWGLARPSRANMIATVKGCQLVAACGQRPRRVHAHFANAPASVAAIAARMLGAACSFTAHAYDVFERPVDMDRKLAAADVPVTVCDYNRAYIAEHWPGYGEPTVVPCGVDTSVFARTRAYRRDPFTVVAVGRLVEKKGFADLIEACARMVEAGGEVRCRILGDGPLRPALTRQIAARGLAGRVTLEGPVGHAGVRDALEQASACCLPCVVAPSGDRDSQPLVLKEAMAVGVPVVASAEVGVPELVDDEVGLLVPPGRPDRLADALARLAGTDDAQLAAMGARGRKRVVEGFSLDAQAEGLLAAWDQTSESAGPSPKAVVVGESDHAAAPVSVVIPTRNRRDLTLRAVGSALAQTRPPQEVIVVDDGSTDDTRASLEAAGDRRVRVVTLDRPQGPAAARNAGIDATRGEYVAFLDSDDTWLPHKLAAQMALFAGQDVGFVYGDVLREHGGDHERRLTPSRVALHTDDALTALVAGWCPPTPSTFVVRRALLDGIRLDPELFGTEDHDLCLALALATSFDAVAEPVAVFRQHTGERVTTDEDVRAQAFTALWAKWRPEMARRGLARAFDRGCRRRLWHVRLRRAAAGSASARVRQAPGLLAGAARVGAAPRELSHAAARLGLGQTGYTAAHHALQRRLRGTTAAALAGDHGRRRPAVVPSPAPAEPASGAGISGKASP